MASNKKIEARRKLRKTRSDRQFVKILTSIRTVLGEGGPRSHYVPFGQSMSPLAYGKKK